MARVFYKSACYWDSKSYVRFYFNYREYNGANYALIPFFLSGQYLIFYFKLEEDNFFHKGVYYMGLIKV